MEIGRQLRKVLILCEESSARDTMRVLLASRHRVICVASAGNDGKEVSVYPAALDNVMGVASTTNNDTLSSFSNYGGDLVWVAAPGKVSSPRILSAPTPPDGELPSARDLCPAPLPSC